MTVQPIGTDDEYRLLCGMSAYLAAVSAAAGVGPESCTLDLDRPMSAYIALDGQLAAYPGRDTALLWDERHGWSLAVETRSGEAALVVAYQGEQIPPPDRVREFARTVPAEAGQPPRPPDLSGDREDLIAGLLEYGMPDSLLGR